MKKAYLMIYARSLGAREEVKACLDSLPEISEWRTEIPNSFYLISEKEASELVPLIKEFMGNKTGAKFFITEITPNKQGWLAPLSWTFINQIKE